MNDEDLKKILLQYRAPEPSGFLEAKLRARIAREGDVPALFPQAVPVLSWQTLAAAGAFSVMLAVGAGLMLGFSQCQRLIVNDTAGSSPLGG